MGTALLTFCFNMGGYSGVAAILVVSLWSWEVSCAHFNPAVTFGSLVHSAMANGEILEKLMQGGAIILAQFCGTFFGIFLTTQSSYISNISDNIREQSPNALYLCPKYTKPQSGVTSAIILV